MNKPKLLLATATAILLTVTARAEIPHRRLQRRKLPDQPTESRKNVKSDAASQRREVILAMKPDVIAFEMGSLSALLELPRLPEERRSRSAALRTRHRLRHQHPVCVPLSKFPIVARHPHTNESFLLNARRFHVSRGFTDVDIKVNDNYQPPSSARISNPPHRCRGRRSRNARFEEGRILRDIVDGIWPKSPTPILSSLGDFNDTYNTKAIKEVVGVGKTKLVDTRPAEQTATIRILPTRAIPLAQRTWTHYYGVEIPIRALIIMLSPAWPKNG